MNLSAYYFCPVLSSLFFPKTAVLSRFAVFCYGSDFGVKSIINMSVLR